MPVYKAVILIAGPQKGTRSCLIHVKAPNKSISQVSSLVLGCT